MPLSTDGEFACKETCLGALCQETSSSPSFCLICSCCNLFYLVWYGRRSITRGTRQASALGDANPRDSSACHLSPSGWPYQWQGAAGGCRVGGHGTLGTLGTLSPRGVTKEDLDKISSADTAQQREGGAPMEPLWLERKNEWKRMASAGAGSPLDRTFPHFVPGPTQTIVPVLSLWTFCPV